MICEHDWESIGVSNDGCSDMYQCPKCYSIYHIDRRVRGQIPTEAVLPRSGPVASHTEVLPHEQKARGTQ